MTIKIPEAEDMLTEYLRRKLTDPQSRITTVSDESHSPAAAATTVTLTNTKLSHIDSVTVDTVTKKIWQDFYITPGATASTLTFDSAFAGTETVLVSYGYITAGNWIYPSMSTDNPNERAEYPRIAIVTVDDPVAYLGSGTSTMRFYPHISIHALCTSEGVSIDSETWGGRNAARKLCRWAFTTIKDNWRDDLSPVLFDFEPISGPVNVPLDEKYRIYRAKADFRISLLDEGESQ